MHDHSGLATPSSGHPGYVFQGVGSPMRQGGEAGMKPREGKHATNPSGFSGVGISPPARGSFISGRPLGPLSFTLQVRGRRCPRSGGGLCLLPQVAPPVSPKRGTPGLLSRPRRLHPAELLGSHARLGPRAAQAPGLRFQQRSAIHIVQVVDAMDRSAQLDPSVGHVSDGPSLQPLQQHLQLHRYLPGGSDRKV